jgi:predicted permease
MRDWNEYLRPHLSALRLDPRREAEIVEELSQHLDQRYNELCADGLTEAEARRRVIEELSAPGSLAAYMRPLRQAHTPQPLPGDAPGAPLFSGLWLDVRIGFRALRRAPAFTATAILTLALAIGANTAIFSVIDAVLLKPFELPEPDRLVVLRGSAPGSDVAGEFGLGAEFYLEYSENSKTLEDIGFFQQIQTTMRAEGHVDRLPMAVASPSFFSTLRVQPMIGRLPTEKDERGSVVVISHWLWQSWFAGDESVLGKNYDISNAQRTVIGIIGPEFSLPQERTAAWIHELVTEPIRPGGFGLNLVARMAPGATLESVAAELAPLARRLPERFGGPPTYTRVIEQHRPVVRTLEDVLVGRFKQPLWILLGTVGIVLLIACANVANLLIVRAESRRRDVAVRRALGARPGVLVRSQMTETMLLATLGGIAGIVLAWASVPLLVRAAPESIPRLGTVGVGATTLLFAAGVTIFSALMAGLLPALRSARVEIAGALRSWRQIGMGPGYMTRDALVVLQTAAALVLLVGSALLFQSFLKLRSVDPGFDTKDIFTFQMAPDRKQFPVVIDGPFAARFHYDFMDRLAALPGVQSVGLVDMLPLDEGAQNQRFSTDRTQASGDAATEPLLKMTYAAGDYFQIMGIRLLSGRYFERNTTPSASVGAIVSQSAANLLWPGENPLGKRLRPSGSSDQVGWITVTGVVEDVMLADFRQAKPDPLVYLPMVGHTAESWVVGTPAYVVKTTRAETIAPEVQELIGNFAPGAPMYRVFTMAGLASRSMAQLSFTTMTLAVAAGLALLLGAIGMYGTLSYMVSQRTNEIGIRMALGAQAGEVQRMIVGHGSRLALIGVGIGLAVTIPLARLLESLLFGIAALDVITFAAMSVAMLGVALFASYLPARRASSVDPIVSLKAE